MFRRVRFRITVLTLSVVVLLYAISSLAIFTIVRHVVFYGIDSNLVTTVQAWTASPTLHTLENLPQGTYIVLQTSSRFLSNAPPPLQDKLLRRFVSAPYTQRPIQWKVPGGPTLRVLYLPVSSGGNTTGYLLAARDINPELNVLLRLQYVLWEVGVGGLAAAALLGFVLAERALRPVRRAWQRQLEFVADASHEMRTPLAVIQSNLGVVLEHTDQSVMDNLEWIHNAHSESRRLSKLVQDLLTLARSDAEALPVVQQPVNLSEVAAHVAELFSPVMDAEQLRLSTQIEESVMVLGDEDRLHQLLVILMDNAAKYTPQGGRIHLQVQSGRTLVTLSVADTGQGIAAGDQKRVFDRFYQADRARAREGSHGAGLGLSIAKWITEAHHGKISLISELDHGTQVVIQLPVLTQARKN